MNLELDTFDDHNFYMRFIASQLLWRQQLRQKNLLDGRSKEQNLYEFSIVNACGLRASGATTAISKMFNPKTDLYIGCNMNMCKEFGKMIEDENSNYTYLNFNSVNFDNTNIDQSELANKIEDFFDNNDLEILQVRELIYDRNKKKRKVKSIDIDDIKFDIVKNIVPCGDDNKNNLDKIRGRFNGDKMNVIYIDLGSFNHREYAIRINRLIKYLSTYILSSDLMFVLT